MKNTKSATYRDAGVDIDAGNRLVERIKPAVKSTQRPGVIGGIGGFGGLFEIAKDKYDEPVLVSGIDRFARGLSDKPDPAHFDAEAVGPRRRKAPA